MKSEPIEITGESQLFADDFLIAHKESVFRRLNRPFKHREPQSRDACTSGKNCRAHNPNVMPPGWSLSHQPESRACNPC